MTNRKGFPTGAFKYIMESRNRGLETAWEPLRDFAELDLSMQVGDRVTSTVALPRRPAGATGVVRETGRLFVVVEFDEGRIGYYARRQLCRVSSSNGSARPKVDLGFTSVALPAGSHLCLLPSTDEEALTTVAQFVIAGIRAGEICLGAASPRWLTSLRRTIRGLGAADVLATNDLLCTSFRDAYLPNGKFSAEKQLARLAHAADVAAGRQVRVFGRLGRGLSRVSECLWWDYEMRVSRVLKDRGITALCVYDVVGPASDQWLGAEATHPFVVRDGRLTAGGPSPM